MGDGGDERKGGSLLSGLVNLACAISCGAFTGRPMDAPLAEGNIFIFICKYMHNV